MTQSAISVEGSGLGGVVVAASLGQLGLDVAPPQAQGPISGPFVTFNEKTLWMIGDLFGPAVLRDLYVAGVAIRRRRLIWSQKAEQNSPESSLLIAPDSIVSRFRQCLVETRSNPALHVFARGRSANNGMPMGRQQAYVWNDTGLRSDKMDWCATFAMEHAWALVAPTPKSSITVQVVCPSPDRSAAEMAAVGALDRLGLRRPNLDLGEVTTIPSAPQLGSLWKHDRIAMGDELIALDPLCGDGIGHTIRSAVWLAGLLKCPDLAPADCRKAFNKRIVVAFAAHVKTCARYYRTIWNADEWRETVSALLNGNVNP